MTSPVSSIPQSPHVRAKRLRRREEILRAALRAFRIKGYHATTLDDIAEQLSMRKTALYHYFPDKESILYACHRESLSEVHRVLCHAQQNFDTATDRLAAVIREHVRVVIHTLQGSSLGFEVTALTADHKAQIVAERDRYERGLRAFIEDGVRAGEFRPLHAKTTVFAILGAINWVSRWYHPDGSIDADELGAQFADYLVGGLTCRKQV